VGKGAPQGHRGEGSDRVTFWSRLPSSVCFEGLARRRVFQSCGVQSDELGKVLRQLGLKKKRLVNLLPLLEFITWSLLKEDGTVRRRRGKPRRSIQWRKEKKSRCDNQEARNITGTTGKGI